MSTKRDNQEKLNLHVRNKNRSRYDLEAMIVSNPELQEYIIPNSLGDNSINFSNPEAVKMLNKAILSHYYGIHFWEFPKENLCPPIPGRAEYLHHVADILPKTSSADIPKGGQVTCLDIGTGASCIYPIIGVTEYQWNFIGSDIDPKSIKSAQSIVNSNPSLKGKISLRIQRNANNIFKGVIESGDKIDISICNPPFHSSIEEALKGTRRKVKNLTGKKRQSPTLNFSGNINELVCEGGEYQFICNMISESKDFANRCFWFTALVSKEANLKGINKFLQKHNPSEIKIIKIKTGNKSSHIIAWTYLSAREKEMW